MKQSPNEACFHQLGKSRRWNEMIVSLCSLWLLGDIYTLAVCNMPIVSVTSTTLNTMGPIRMGKAAHETSHVSAPFWQSCFHQLSIKLSKNHLPHTNFDSNEGILYELLAFPWTFPSKSSKCESKNISGNTLCHIQFAGNIFKQLWMTVLVNILKLLLFYMIN